jgi:voltage-gated potassium channel
MKNWFNRFIIIIILASTITIILGTEPYFFKKYPEYFFYANIVFAAIFTLELIYRVINAGTIKYIFTPMAIIDILALIPFYLVAFSDGFLLRILRLLRLISIIKLGRYTSAFNQIMTTLFGKRYELLIAFGMSFFAIIVASTVMYVIEGQDNPDNFGSIIRAMWWGMATLTTIGYGDVYPITVAGKIFTTFYALIGIGLVGMLGGIMAGAFMECFQKKIDQDNEYPTDEDYHKYELAFNLGKKDALENNEYINPYKKELSGLRITQENAYAEGYNLHSNKERVRKIQIK